MPLTMGGALKRGLYRFSLRVMIANLQNTMGVSYMLILPQYIDFLFYVELLC